MKGLFGLTPGLYIIPTLRDEDTQFSINPKGRIVGKVILYTCIEAGECRGQVVLRETHD